jgi:hypothetical protein
LLNRKRFPCGRTGVREPAASDQRTLPNYPPINPNGTAIVIAPRGAYSRVAMNHEGQQIANWLNAIGVTAFVLKYRIGSRYHHPIELGDAQRAMRLVRARAAEFCLESNRIGRLRRAGDNGTRRDRIFEVSLVFPRCTRRMAESTKRRVGQLGVPGEVQTWSGDNRKISRGTGDDASHLIDKRSGFSDRRYWRIPTTSASTSISPTFLLTIRRSRSESI